MKHWWVLPVLVVLVAGLGVAAGYGVRELAGRDGSDAGRAETAPPTTVVSGGEAGGDEGPGAAPGPRAVQLAPDALAHPDSSAIQQLLQRHFDAINNRDFVAWQATVTRQRAAGFPEARWLDQYHSTADGTILVHRIEPATTGGLVALISFISTQDRKLAPNQLSDCLRWRVSYSVVLERGELRLGPSDPDASQYQAC